MSDREKLRHKLVKDRDKKIYDYYSRRSMGSPVNAEFDGGMDANSVSGS